MASDWHNWDLNSGRLFPDPVPYALCLTQKPPSMGDPPEIPLQLLLLHQLCHNGAHQHSVHHGSQDEIPEDAHRPEPAGAEKGSEGGCGEGHMPAGLGPDSCPHSGQPLSHLRAPWGLCSYVGAPGTLTETHYRAKGRAGARTGKMGCRWEGGKTSLDPDPGEWTLLQHVRDSGEPAGREGWEARQQEERLHLRKHW